MLNSQPPAWRATRSLTDSPTTNMDTLHDAAIPLSYGPTSTLGLKVVIDIGSSLLSVICMTLLALLLAEFSSKIATFLLTTPTKSSSSRPKSPLLCSRKRAVYSTEQYIHTKEQFFGMVCSPIVEISEDAWGRVEYTSPRSSLSMTADEGLFGPEDVWSPMSG